MVVEIISILVEIARRLCCSTTYWGFILLLPIWVFALTAASSAKVDHPWNTPARRNQLVASTPYHLSGTCTNHSYVTVIHVIAHLTGLGPQPAMSTLHTDKTKQNTQTRTPHTVHTHVAPSCTE